MENKSTNRASIEESEKRAGPRRWLNWMTGLALGIGLGIGILAALAALGVWIGLWDFRMGFSMLGMANGFGLWVALLCLLLALAIFLISRQKHIDSGPKLSGLALIGAVAAALAWYVPETYRPAEGSNIPAIHEISTDTENPPEFVAVLPLRADAPNGPGYGDSGDMTPERLAQLQQEAYPDIQTLVLDMEPDEAFERALSAVDEMGWELVAAAPEEGRIEATDTTFWFRFKDDVVIRIQPGPEGTLVDARSKSRVGVSDVGKNAERLREFFSLLES